MSTYRIKKFRFRLLFKIFTTRIPDKYFPGVSTHVNYNIEDTETSDTVVTISDNGPKEEEESFWGFFEEM